MTLGTAPIFTNGVDWTRVDIGAFTNPGVGLNVGAGQSPLEGQTLTASATTNDSDATLHYQWQESSSPSFTTFTDIGSDSSSYVVQESDVGSFIRVVASTSDPDNSQSATATSQVTGAVTPVAPALSVSNVTLSEDSSAGFPITVTPFNPNDPIGISISGIPSDVSLSDNAGPLTIAGGSVTLTPAQLAGLTLTAGAAESATLTVTATNEAGATKSVSQLVNLDATPVAPTISISPAGVSVNEDGTVALPITVTPFDLRDSVSVIIGGIPPGGTLKDGVGDTFAGGGLPATLTLAQFDSGVSLTVGPQIPATPDQLTVQAYNNSNGVASAPLQFLPVTVDPVAPALLAPATLSVNEDSSASLPITVTPFDASDNVLVTIAGLPSDATLTDGDNDRFTGGQSWTLSLAQVDSGLTLHAGEDTTTNLTVTATNEGGPALGQMASTSQSIALTVNPVSEGPVLGGNKSGSFIEGALVTLGATDTVADIDDTLGNVTITDLPADLTNVNGGAYTPGTGTWTGTAAQFSALSFNAGEQGTYLLSISAATTGAEAGITTESYTLTVNPISEGPLLGGAMSATVSEGGSVTFGATDTVSDGDDTLGNVTITGLPHDLTGFTGGGTYTAGTGTWTGTAAQFGALSFKAGEKGIFNLSVAATTTGAEAGTTTGSYTLTINPAAPVLGGATSADVNPLNTVTFGATDTAAFADDTLGERNHHRPAGRPHQLQWRHLHGRHRHLDRNRGAVQRAVVQGRRGRHPCALDLGDDDGRHGSDHGELHADDQCAAGDHRHDSDRVGAKHRPDRDGGRGPHDRPPAGQQSRDRRGHRFRNRRELQPGLYRRWRDADRRWIDQRAQPHLRVRIARPGLLRDVVHVALHQQQRQPHLHRPKQLLRAERAYEQPRQSDHRALLGGRGHARRRHTRFRDGVAHQRRRSRQRLQPGLGVAGYRQPRVDHHLG